MQEWEYMQDDVNWPKMAGDAVDLPKRWEMLEIGRNGWELVSTVRTPSGTVSSLFKRLKTVLRAGVPALPSVPKQQPTVPVKTRKGGRA